MMYNGQRMHIFENQKDFMTEINENEIIIYGWLSTVDLVLAPWAPLMIAKIETE